MRNMTPMSAAHATADEYDVLLAADGCLWLRRHDRWTYVTTGGVLGLEDEELALGYDWRDALPVEYEPYLGLDEAAAMAVGYGLAARGLGA